MLYIVCQLQCPEKLKATGKTNGRSFPLIDRESGDDFKSFISNTWSKISIIY